MNIDLKNILFKKINKFFVLLLCVFISHFAFAAGLNIPASSTVDVNAGTLNVAGNIDIDGTLEASTGTITLTGNWDNSSGTFTAGTGTVKFTATTGTQTLTSGGISSTKAFYNLTHATSGTVQLSTNNMTLNNHFANSAGTFDANGWDMSVVGNWTNSSPGTFSAGTATVTFSGTSQSIIGST